MTKTTTTTTMMKAGLPDKGVTPVINPGSSTGVTHTQFAMMRSNPRMHRVQSKGRASMGVAPAAMVTRRDPARTLATPATPAAATPRTRGGGWVSDLHPTPTRTPTSARRSSRRLLLVHETPGRMVHETPIRLGPGMAADAHLMEAALGGPAMGGPVMGFLESDGTPETGRPPKASRSQRRRREDEDMNASPTPRSGTSAGNFGFGGGDDDEEPDSNP